MIARSLFALALVLPAAASAQEAGDGDFRVVDIQARLLYEQSGALSVDISDNPDFTAWNTIIGEGSASENANDLLVTAVIRGPGEHNLDAPLTITARDEDGKVLATRTVKTILAETTTYLSMVVYDAGCAGTMRLEARLGQSVRREEISLDCGE